MDSIPIDGGGYPQVAVTPPPVLHDRLQDELQ